jgi:hypothetical protein
MELRGGGEAWELNVHNATALAKFFNPDADPIVVGLGFHALSRLQGYSRHGPYGYYPHTYTDHHWQVVWPMQYERYVRTNIKRFFTRLIRIAHPGDTVGGRRVRAGRGVRKYEFFRVENNDDDDPGDDDETVEGMQYYECVAGPSQIMFKIVRTSMRNASDAETEEDPMGDD